MLQIPIATTRLKIPIGDTPKRFALLHTTSTQISRTTYFPVESDIFNLVPADDSFEFLGEDDAIRLAVPTDRIQTLIRGGFLDDRDAHFGIYPE